MSEVKSSAGYTSTSGGDGGLFMVHTPVWCTVVRGFQAFFGFVILILSGLLIHGLAMDAVVFALVCGLFTFIVVTYALVSEKAPNCRNAYNIWAILALDLFMAILWLASMGANAALRATFKVNVNASCWDDGSAINAGHCVISKRNAELGKRVTAVSGTAGLAQMSAVAGLSALNWLLFIATLVYNGHAFRMYHQEKKARGGDVGHVEMKGQQDPAMNASQEPGQQYAQYADQNEYMSQVYQQQQPVQAQQQPYDPTYYEQTNPAAYSVATQQTPAYGGAYPQQTSDQYQQQAYDPHSTPAQHQQPYQPPAQ